jgi:hypothetical protein
MVIRPHSSRWRSCRRKVRWESSRWFISISRIPQNQAFFLLYQTILQNATGKWTQRDVVVSIEDSFPFYSFLLAIGKIQRCNQSISLVEAKIYEKVPRRGIGAGYGTEHPSGRAGSDQGRGRQTFTILSPEVIYCIY